MVFPRRLHHAFVLAPTPSALVDDGGGGRRGGEIQGRAPEGRRLIKFTPLSSTRDVGRRKLGSFSPPAPEPRQTSAVTREAEADDAQPVGNCTPRRASSPAATNSPGRAAADGELQRTFERVTIRGAAEASVVSTRRSRRHEGGAGRSQAPAARAKTRRSSRGRGGEEVPAAVERSTRSRGAAANEERREERCRPARASQPTRKVLEARENFRLGRVAGCDVEAQSRRKRNETPTRKRSTKRMRGFRRPLRRGFRAARRSQSCRPGGRKPTHGAAVRPAPTATREAELLASRNRSRRCA